MTVKKSQPAADDMSKLSEGLKALINASYARPGYTRAPSNIKSIFMQLANDAKSKNVGLPALVTMSTAASMTLNCPEALTALLQTTSTTHPTSTPSTTAELIREVGLKCISFNGIPRTINCLATFHASLPADLQTTLSHRTASRSYTQSNLAPRLATGRHLWNSVYAGVETKLLDRLAVSHPDLPIHILTSHYSNLLSDPPSPSATPVPGAKVGRVLTSLVAITCLRAQTGVGPQVISHILGLRKAYTQGEDKGEGEEEVEGGEWLAGDEGGKWLLESVDEIVRAVEAGRYGERAGEGKAKL